MPNSLIMPRFGCGGCTLRGWAGWAFTDLKIPRLELYVEPWNTSVAAHCRQRRFPSRGLLRSWQELGGERKDMHMLAKLRGAELG
ncbi:hypothetical protein R3Q06_32300 [Rhodococcus erythropolis]|uniref:hypothetical protein n=1 Tax=Rhodococcus erythropolis TaxID=1833 RepID=UPI00294A395F|nr:hypothetical protein [Rhodococcus erythropolis]MDV6278155.1 hypothetical protein [Rhodococcus erythropolis]